MQKPNYDFSKDLPIAKKTESQIARHLVETQDMTFIGTSDSLPNVKRSDFDVRMKFNKSGKVVDIEIKEDFSCARTGNIGVECESWGRKSGIEVSKADFYLYKIHMSDGRKGVYIIQTKKLKQLIEDEKYHRIVVGGDPGSYSKNYLFKLSVVFENFKFLGNLPE
jgi:ADP-glucose pyrophosphorylase